MNEQLIKLSQLSIHLINILDKELIDLQNRDCNNKIVELKTIVNIFSKIVDTIVQLQKFNKDNQIKQCDELTSEDLNIIKRFIDRHSKT
ncbi:hypothetical protein [Orientia tsutsugamushi]|uniref:Uncharacterized protein n=1 Tax=Orientia tsutsugamushi str. TA716 TaxID=1359175 RepID=A0A0F3P6L2_ORITS|nr:hypothetical protein [Orientia tsutsugamushi]KJV75541.1 hypothetical protein OTSTA716_1036 [Orientia tsutsugamushi str. TA716]